MDPLMHKERSLPIKEDTVALRLKNFKMQNSLLRSGQSPDRDGHRSSGRNSLQKRIKLAALFQPPKLRRKEEPSIYQSEMTNYSSNLHSLRPNALNRTGLEKPNYHSSSIAQQAAFRSQSEGL